MIQKYPDSAQYLGKQLYPCREVLQTTQRIESYNSLIKKHVNGTTSLFELINTIEKLLVKEGRYQRFNEVVGVLPNIYNEEYYTRYFKAVDKSCQKFLMTAVLKIQRREINCSIYYKAQLANLEDETGQVNMNITSKPVISTTVNKQIGQFEHNLQVNFTHLNNIRGDYVFTSKVHKEISHKKLWGEGFGVMKKTLDLAIAMGKYDELYDMHLKLANKMEIELIRNNGHNIQNDDDPAQFAITISNPIGVYSKGRKPKNGRLISFNDNKYKKRKIDNTTRVDHKALGVHRNELSDITNLNVSHRCGICGKTGHNSHICNMNSPNEDDYSDHKDDDLSLLVEKNNMENLNFTNQGKFSVVI
ncbi:1561_t:CDS:2 [Racocetra fulgida]|uniref:1561_t:CDS:1 n=1 Tax=Racocetra fulgida TaxID=60492 RepID=A0A9N8VD62_9GLOM|nr:1561_t:CDS:2 [Racocetra fulgida]